MGCPDPFATNIRIVVCNHQAKINLHQENNV